MEVESLWKRFPCHNIPFYLSQRNLSKTDLEKYTDKTDTPKDKENKKDPHKHRNTLTLACDGDQKTMSYKKIKKVAEALHVDIEDLGTPEEELVYIKHLASDILNAIEPVDIPGFPAANSNSLPVRYRQLKAERIAAYLKMDKQDAILANTIIYLLKESNWIERAYACYYVTLVDPNLLDHWEHPVFTNAFQRVKYYLTQPKYKKLYPSLDLFLKKHDIGITRQTFYHACNGQIIKNSDQLLMKMASALKIEHTELFSPLQPAVHVFGQDIKNKIQDAIDQCRPKILEMKYHVLTESGYLKNWDIYTEYLLGWLLLPSPKKKESSVPNPHAVEALDAMKQFHNIYKDRLPSGIKICYIQEEDGFYNAAVLFEDWVYKLFPLDVPFTSPALIDFPISIETDLLPEDDDFESELKEQVLQSLMENEIMSISEDHAENSSLFPFGLASILEEYLEESFACADIVAYDSMD
ncbi:MAG: hypothetical protein HFG54_12515 [Lachnospiraceae bacterium]|nr:hypothetical protein [Lachnospiraceae bacterium]